MAMNRSFNNVSVLDNESLLKYAPSIFAQSPSTDLSSKYAFIPTIQVIDTLRAQGWTPVSASQSKSKDAANVDQAKHIIRFRSQSDIGHELVSLGDSLPELVLTNSHDGSTSFKLMLGLFRQVCSNGLIVSDSLCAETIRHMGYKNDQVIDASFKIIQAVPQLTESVASLREITLNQDEKLALASSALSIKYSDDDTKPEPQKLLTLRRYADDKSDLWTVFNVIQENMIQGGLRTYAKDENGRTRRNSTRAVNSVSENVRLNKALWTLAEEMKRIKTA